jgi:murein DD-endopeptidase MepM/ murein hydrolase activator NlpD
MAERSDFYTVMFVPDDHGRTFSIRVRRNILRAVVLFLLVFAGGLVALMFMLGDIGVKLQFVKALRIEKARLQNENERLLRAFQKIRKLEVLSDYLHRMALDGIDSARMSRFGEEQQTLAIAATDTGAPVDRERTNNGGEKAAAPDRPQDFVLAIPSIPPVEGWVTRGFSAEKTGSSSEPHAGIDIAAAAGTPIRAPAPGVVDRVGRDAYYGLLVVVKHRFGFESRYGHCSQVLVAAGDNVQRGQTIALVGSSGRSSAPHLHYEILRDGKALDPKEYLFTSVYE